MPKLRALAGMLLALTFAMEPNRAAAQVATTQVGDTIYRADGTAATGTVLVSWGAFTTASGQTVPAGTTSAVIAPGGLLSLRLAPNAGATPFGSYYTAVFHLDDGSVSREYWVIPVSVGMVGLGAVRNSVLPTSVAMQTVSKSYVDTAIAVAVSGHPLDSTPYVLKVGDTMAGPLVLPADPVSGLQAADKHYVDVSVGAVSAGLGQKVSTLPQTTQTVAQPAGTQLQVNQLNGVEYASQYVAGTGNNGIANATLSADCVGGCELRAEQTYASGEAYNPASWNSQTHVRDARLGEERDSYFNPRDLLSAGQDAGQVIDVQSTRTAQNVHALTGAVGAASIGLLITGAGLAGGANLFPASIDSQVPYFKTTYSALALHGVYNTVGQHVLAPRNIECYAVGDCLIGSQFILSSGGYRDEADEGAHPYDLQVAEDARVFQGRCTSGCTTGSTSVLITTTASPGTQGEGRFLIDLNPAGMLTTGTLTGAGSGLVYPTALFSGTGFPVSVFFATAQAVTSQANDVAPGTVSVAIATTGVPAGYATSTAAAAAASGVACVADPNSRGTYTPPNFEMANYLVLDGTHVQLTFNKAHAAGSTISLGGLCGYGLEQTVDTAAGIRQVFPVIGSYSPTGLYYAGAATPIVGLQGATSAFLNVALTVASIARNGNVVTVTTAGNLPVDVNGLGLTVAGVADSSYNGIFAVTTTGPNSLSYSEAGANSTSTGGTLTLVTGGYALYPMAEVLGVFNPATRSVDGLMTLAPNLVHWTPNDIVEEPHYYQVRISGDVELISQVTPRPTAFQQSGKSYLGNVGPGIQGWVIGNSVPASHYLGNGGTHTQPDFAYQATGVWNTTMDAQAGDRSVFNVHCNSRGCGRWNSAYDLFELDSKAGVDTVNYAPSTSALTVTVRGAAYGFTPTGFNAGTINVGTLNATVLHGSVDAGSVTSGTFAAARLPVFGASGVSHGAGSVPDPGAVSGTTRYLREDGSWVAPSGGGAAVAAITSGTIDGTAIGATQPATSVTSSGTVTLVSGLATATANQNSPVMYLDGATWNGTASGVDSWSFQSLVGTGPSPANILSATHNGPGPAQFRISNPTGDGVLMLNTYGTSAYMSQHNYEPTLLASSQGWSVVQTGAFPIKLGVSNVMTFGSAAQFQVDGTGNVTAPNLRSVLMGTTAAIGGSALAAGACTTGTAAVSGASLGSPVDVAASDGSLPGGAVMVRGAVTAINTVTVQVCAIAATTPAAISYNARVIQ